MYRSPSSVTVQSGLQYQHRRPFVLTEALLPLVQKSKDPRIINVLPVNPYRISKAALNMATACMHADYAPWGAKVWAYCPGYVDTDLEGEEDRQARRDRGAESSETSAVGILEILDGKRDGEVGAYLQRRGQQFPW